MIFHGGNYSSIYRVSSYGDSLTDQDDEILSSIPLYSKGSLLLKRNGVAGHTLTQIKAVLDADFPNANVNTVVIEGGINDITAGNTLATMTGAIDAMIATVEQNGAMMLIVLGITPIGNDSGHTPARQALLESYNSYLLATYPQYYIATYDALVNPGGEDLANDYYLSPGNLHPQPVGSRKIDELLVNKFNFKDDYKTLTENSGNLLTDWRDISNGSAWTQVNVNPNYNGLPIILSDNVLTGGTGIVANLNNLKHGVSQTFNGKSSGSVVTAECLIRPGDQSWAFIEYTTNDGTVLSEYIDVINRTKGTASGTFNSYITKFAPGWIKYTMMLTQTAGASQDTLAVSAAVADSDNDYAGNARAPGIFTDALQVY